MVEQVLEASEPHYSFPSPTDSKTGEKNHSLKIQPAYTPTVQEPKLTRKQILHNYNATKVRRLQQINNFKSYFFLPNVCFV